MGGTDKYQHINCRGLSGFQQVHTFTGKFSFLYILNHLISSHLFATKWMRNKDGLTSHNPAVCTNECHHIYRQTVTDHMPYIDPKIFRLPLCWGLGLYT
jgi:hypothetical protein